MTATPASPVGSPVALVIDGAPVAITGHKLSAYADQPASFDAWDVDRGNLVSGHDGRLVGMVENRHHRATPDVGPTPLQQTGQHIQHPGFGQCDGSPCERQLGSHRSSSKSA